MVEPLTWLNIGIIGFGLLLILVETLQPGFFIGAVGSTLALVGLIGLFVPGLYQLGVWTILLILVVGTLSVLANLFVYKRWGEPGDKPITLSVDSLPGMTGKAVTQIPAGGSGKVRIHGQTWSAEAAQAIEDNAPIRVVRVDGLILTVEKES